MRANIAPDYYVPVPDEFESEVRTALGGNQEGYIDIKGPTPLSAWAKQQRKKRNKQAKISRKQNRGK